MDLELNSLTEYLFAKFDIIRMTKLAISLIQFMIKSSINQLGFTKSKGISDSHLIIFISQLNN